jgi:hypothetical protein
MIRSALLLILAFSAQAAKVPNLSGTWRLQVEKSDFAAQPPARSRVLVIHHRDPQLRIQVTEVNAAGVESKPAVASYTTDGQPSTNDVFGNSMTAVTVWKDKILEMETRGKFGTNEILLRDRYELSKDRKTLILRRHFEGQRGGTQDQVLVHTRASRP